MKTLDSRRIKTLDVIRGLTMTLVVFHHVRGTTFDLYSSPSVISQLFVALRMPMFFFISGFVASKAVEAWTGTFALKRFATKARIELIPTIVFFSIFVGCTSWQWSFPGGYWFTVALTAMFGLYYTVSALCRRCCPRHRSAILIAIGLLLYAVVPVMTLCHCDMHDINKWFPTGKSCEFFIFFAIGSVCGARKTEFLDRLCRNSVITTAIITGSVCLTLLIMKDQLHIDTVSASVLSLAGSACLVAAVLSFFWKHRDYWNADGRLSRTMQFVGRRTLDIYMIHWFLLPRIPAMKSLFWHRNNDILEVVIIGAVSIAIVAGCLAISGLIRTSPFLAKWLFAASAAAPRPAQEMSNAPLPETDNKKPGFATARWLPAGAARLGRSMRKAVKRITPYRLF